MAESSQGIRAGRAFVEATLDTSKLKTGVLQAGKILESMGGAIRNIGLQMIGLGTSIVTPLLGAATVFSEIGSDLVDMADRTGLSVEALSELKYAAGQSGTSIEALEKAVSKMQKSIVDADNAMGDAEDRFELTGKTGKKALDSLDDSLENAAGSFADLGIDMAVLRGLSPEGQFKMIADAIAGVEDPAERAAAAMGIFGKSGAELLPLFKAGSAGIEELQKRARELGLTISTEDAVAAEAFGDTMGTLWDVLKQNVFVIGSALAPSISRLSQHITDAATLTAAWIKKNKGLVNIALALGGATTVAGGALVTFGIALTTVSKIIDTAGKGFSIVKMVASALGPVFAGLLSPMGLLVAGAVALGGYLVYASGAGGKALAWLGARFAGLKETAISAFKGIGDALAKGDIALAGQILWAALKLAWQQGVLELQKILPDFGRMFDAVGESILGGWIRVTGFLERAWITASANIRGTFFKMFKSLLEGFHAFARAAQPITVALATRLARVMGKLQGLSDEEIEQHIKATIETNVDRELGNQEAATQQLRDILGSNAEQEDKEKAAAIENQVATETQKLRDLQKISDDRDAKSIADRLAAIAETEAKIAKLKADLKALTDRAGEPGDGEAPDRLDPFKLPDLDGALKVAQKISAPIGTFSARDAGRLGGGDSIQKKIAEHTRKTAENTERMMREITDNSIAFA